MAANLFSQEEEELEEKEDLAPISTRNTVVKYTNKPEESSSDQEMEEMLENKAENDGISAMRR